MFDLSAAHDLALTILQSDPGNQAMQRLAEQIEQARSGSHAAIVRLGEELYALPSPVRPLLYYALGEYHRGNGQLELAVAHLKKADELDHTRWQTKLALGLACFVQGNYREAQPWFQEASRLGPAAEAAPAYEHIAEIVLRNRRDGDLGLLLFIEQAQKLYEKAGDSTGASRCRLRLSEPWRGGRDPEQVLEMAQGLDPEPARQALEMGFRRHNLHPKVAFRFGQACLALDRGREACAAFMRVCYLPASEWHGPAYELLADTYQGLQLYPADLNRFYQRAEQAYSAYGEEQPAQRCRQKLSNLAAQTKS